MKIVAKFGGSSLANAKQFIKVKAIVADNKPLVVVPSAPGKAHQKDYKITDLLYMCHQLVEHGLNCDEVYQLVEVRYRSIVHDLALDFDVEQMLKETKDAISGGASKDYCASRGEYMNGLILAKYLNYNFIDAKDIIHIKDGQWDAATTHKQVAEKLIAKMPCVVPGFYGGDPAGKVVTFSRGGSDITGSILAACISADRYENWTDVSGLLAVDPTIIPNAKPMRQVSYKELRELSYMGARVLHEEAIFPVKEQKIPIHIKNTNCPDEAGTIIVADSNSNKGVVTGIAGRKDFMVFSVEKTFLFEERGFYRKLVSVFETNGISIAHMPSGIDSISVIVVEADVRGKEKKVMKEIDIYCAPDSVDTSHQLALIAVVGQGMVSTKGVAARIFKSLANNDVNIRMINQGASELSIIVGVENKDFEQAIAAIYHEFHEEDANEKV